jgi:hypothetical protein
MRTRSTDLQRAARSVPLIAFAVATAGAGIAIAFQALPLPPQGELLDQPALFVRMQLAEEGAPEVLLTQTVRVGSDEVNPVEVVWLELQSATGEPPAIARIDVGWSGMSTWSCWQFKDDNPAAGVDAYALPAGNDAWDSADAEPLSVDFANYLAFYSMGMDTVIPRFDRVLVSEFPDDAIDVVTGVACDTEPQVLLHSQAVTRVLPSHVVLELVGFDGTTIRTERIDNLSVPRGWERTTGLVEVIETPEPQRFSNVGYASAPYTTGDMGGVFSFHDPARQTWLDITIATFTLLLSALLGVIVQVFWDWFRPKPAGEAPEGTVESPPALPPAAGGKVARLRKVRRKREKKGK